MGNSVGGRKKAKVVKINGETLKLKTPATAWDVIRDNSQYVLLESKAVKKFGVRAVPLEAHEQLKPKKVYFLVDRPKLPDREETPAALLPARLASSSVQASGKDSLVLSMVWSRRLDSNAVRIKMRLSRAQMHILVEESTDEADLAKKIVDLYVQKSTGNAEGGGMAADGVDIAIHRQVQMKLGLATITES